ncbi:MAG: hypothetical protein KGJ94_09510 [Xanthomonadaceae bacterium]|nr:hypothetical protein [Xanthomonadaceae bacterium]
MKAVLVSGKPGCAHAPRHVSKQRSSTIAKGVSKSQGMEARSDVQDPGHFRLQVNRAKQRSWTIAKI